MLRCLKFFKRREKDINRSDDLDQSDCTPAVSKLIGQGGFAKVYSVAGGNKSLYAVKVAEPQNARQLERVEMEILIHEGLDDRRIVKMLDSMETFAGQFYICMEYCERGSLYSYVKHLRQEKSYMDTVQICNIFGQLIEGCQYLHERCVIHRDLKPQNILLTNSMDVKITDFGLAILTHGKEQVWASVWGSPGYVPPEVLIEPKYTTAADVWALGCVLFWMYAGFVAFPERDLKSRNYRRKVRRLATLQETMKKWNAVTVRDLLLQLLEEQPDKRPSCTTILNHDFFKQGGVQIDKEIHTHDRAVAKRHAFSRPPFNLDYWAELFGH